jgi:arsenite methyltransferase
MAKTAAKAGPPAPAAADYGLDAPKLFRHMITRGVLIIALGAGFWVMNRSNAPRSGLALFVALGLFGAGFLAAAAVMYWSSRTAKIRVRDQILDVLPWRGDEKVLDVGCGRGLMLIGAAKRLKTGRAFGVDTWSQEDLSGNSAEAAMANAKAEGVADRIRVENADARRLPYSTASYDVVLSSLAIHNLPSAADREKAVLEMLRVLKPAGYLAIFDVLKTGEYKRTLEQGGAEIVRDSGLSFLWCVPTRWLVARKKD